MRRTSLVDLPQFINILNGDMSLVGPRPLRPSEVEAYELWHRGRSTPPGHPPSLGDLDATVYAPLKPAPRSGAIALPEPNDAEDTDPNSGGKANVRSVSVEPPKTSLCKPLCTITCEASPLRSESSYRSLVLNVELYQCASVSVPVNCPHDFVRMVTI